MYSSVIFLLWGWFTMGVVAIRFRHGQHDFLFVARCEARCWNWSVHSKSSCVQDCLTKQHENPGNCPSNISSLSPFAVVCLDACQYDSQCTQLQKCCKHNCGVTCQPSENLRIRTDIPKIPTQIKIKEGQKRKLLYITWKHDNHSKETAVLYVIEERYHIGRNFVEGNLKEWYPCVITHKKNYALKHITKLGRWYQFRVAAVNENGTKGYSEPSSIFSLSKSPKVPKAPGNVTVGSVWSTNKNYLNVELKWTAPYSDLPIQKYRVFWSKRLQGATALDSVLVNQCVTSKDRTSTVLKYLQHDSLYFLQVQAIVQFGEDRLKGEKSGLILNTTHYKSVNDSSSRNEFLLLNQSSELILKKFFWVHRNLRARIVWDSQIPLANYTVSWWTGGCRNKKANLEGVFMAAITNGSYFDLYDLQFECLYRVSVKLVPSEDHEETKLWMDNKSMSTTFSTPTCQELKSTFKKMYCG